MLSIRLFEQLEADAAAPLRATVARYDRQQSDQSQAVGNAIRAWE